MNRKQRIEKNIQKTLNPSFFEVIDNSIQHKGHLPEDNLETHFHITVHSTKFKGLSKANCHRLVYDTLQEEFKSGLHAITITTKEV